VAVDYVRDVLTKMEIAGNIKRVVDTDAPDIGLDLSMD
jgi:hypothetical protein